ncbi:MAG: hypothetical protein LBU32_26870 [Clostridiales bacterium]|jgi:hypothetical protein|nr:hypothetical protein [Clostridiales bacterium]
MYRGIRKRYFCKDTVKACIYVKELAGFLKYRMLDGDYPGAELYNCTYEPPPSVSRICESIKMVAGMKRRTLLIHGWLLMAAASCAAHLGELGLGIHPDRIRKVMESTNISGRKLAESGYDFRYTLEEILRDWLEDCGGECLF